MTLSPTNLSHYFQNVPKGLAETVQSRFTDVQHSFIYETRRHFDHNGKEIVQRHPFAAFVLGKEIASSGDILLGVSVTNPLDNMVRSIGKIKALQKLVSKNASVFLLDNTLEHNLDLIGYHRLFRQHEEILWGDAEHTFQNIIKDIQGIRFKDVPEKHIQAAY
jgi:hypothetical protein